MRERILTREQWLSKPKDEIFAYFADARNLQELTPPWLHFRILTSDLENVDQDLIIEYRIRWRWIPIFWRTRITDWEPTDRFVDEQQKGPYSLWRHEHTFEEKEGGTLMRDVVRYAVPGWIFEPLLHRWIVRPDLERIFDYRRDRLASLE